MLDRENTGSALGSGAVDADFWALVCEDEEWLRAEFDAIVSEPAEVRPWRPGEKGVPLAARRSPTVPRAARGGRCALDPPLGTARRTMATGTFPSIAEIRRVRAVVLFFIKDADPSSGGDAHRIESNTTTSGRFIPPAPFHFGADNPRAGTPAPASDRRLIAQQAACLRSTTPVGRRPPGKTGWPPLRCRVLALADSRRLLRHPQNSSPVPGAGQRYVVAARTGTVLLLPSPPKRAKNRRTSSAAMRGCTASACST